jgi:hypothetical protein
MKNQQFQSEKKARREIRLRRFSSPSSFFSIKKQPRLLHRGCFAIRLS